MLSTIALFASSRRQGNTGTLIDHVAMHLDIEVLDLSEIRMSPFDYDHRNRGDDFEQLMERILRYEQILFAAPIYWYAVPPPMKTFFDRINDLLELPDLQPKGRQLRGKRALVVATSGNDVISPSFASMFRETFAYLGMEYRGALHVNCTGGYQKGQFEREIQDFVSLVKEGKELPVVPMTQRPT